MSYNSKAFLADRERLLEPNQVLIKGSRKWHQSGFTQYATMQLPPPDMRTEEEWLKINDDYLRKQGII